MIRFVARTYPPCWVLKARIQKHRGKPLLFHDMSMYTLKTKVLNQLFKSSVSDNTL